MALGDGIRRDVALISEGERNRLRSTEGGGHTLVWRDLIAGAPAITSDHGIITAGDGSPQQDQYNAMLNAMQIAHGYAHSVSVAPAAPYAVLIPPGTVTVHHTAHLALQARIWFAFTGTTAGTNAPAGAVTIHCDQTGQDFHFTLQANTIARPTVGVMLVLDQSGSMGWPTGTGDTRINVLHESAARFVELVQAHNGVGMVRFDNNAYPGVPVTTFGARSFDPNRVATLAAIQAVSPNGTTSIGNGSALGRTTLNAVSGFDQKAMIVFTDGLENTPQYIADVMGLIDNRTFAIGLGTTQQVSIGPRYVFRLSDRITPR